MSIKKDFSGLNGYVWWYGIVEDRLDPLKIGRVRVRIIGWHSENKELLPTDKLPWAQLQVSPNSPRTFSGPKIGEWVSGYFLDGELGQKPIVTGVIPGINLVTTRQPAGSPQIPGGQVYDGVDEPSTPPTARGRVQNTAISQSNNQLAHVCDETLGIRIRAGFARIKNSELVQKIRAAINALIDSLNFSDTSGFIGWTIEQLKWIASVLKTITDAVNEVLEFVNVVKLIVVIARRIIDYILGLPAKIARWLGECIAVVLAAVQSGLSDVFTVGTSVPGAEGIDDLFTAVQDTYSAAGDLVSAGTELVQAPAEILALAATATSVEDQERTVAGVINYVSTTTQNSSAVVEENTYNPATVVTI